MRGQGGGVDGGRRAHPHRPSGVAPGVGPPVRAAVTRRRRRDRRRRFAAEAASAAPLPRTGHPGGGAPAPVHGGSGRRRLAGARAAAVDACPPRRRARCGGVSCWRPAPRVARRRPRRGAPSAAVGGGADGGEARARGAPLSGDQLPPPDAAPRAASWRGGR
ncbi:hypothetical protein BU14_1264s0004 [Porphyra umbilicalis]|uniref:Uncharacterized protein n=1 Tax=Porphyra umbilicalis TaxID=2786 RepID=A0A1X6NM83_PORUM|nr:hypothetical protein BU14_1264s0004 [Porphyra umbilicalis]|eukprot:OSX69698.1 hypothetical protein BU14_1264s0004 [Porphyra umbilicalis]